MIKDYEEFLPVIERKLAALDFNLKENTDYIATFSNDTVWEIRFEGDRYARPSYTIWLESREEGAKNRFALWLLIKTFEERKNLDESIYSLEQELDWLIVNSSKVFINPPPYAADYEKLNAVEY